MIHRHKFNRHCEHCGEPLPSHPEPNEYVAHGVMVGLNIEGEWSLPTTGVKCWRCPVCGERTWVYGFPIDERRDRRGVMDDYLCIECGEPYETCQCDSFLCAADRETMRKDFEWWVYRYLADDLPTLHQLDEAGYDLDDF